MEKKACGNVINWNFTFLISFISAYSLKCYVCTGTEETCSKSKLEADKASKSVDCPTDKCMRLWGKKDDVTEVINSCSTSAICTATEKACDELKEGKCAVGCCDSDYCNAGSSFSFSVILMTVTSALGLALLK